MCNADTTGGLVLELVMTRRTGTDPEAKFRIANVHVGNTNLRELNLVSRTSCAWFMKDDDRPGDRFLYFTHPDFLDDNEGLLFECALNSNIYRMNRRGTRIEYPVGVNGQNDRLAFRNFSPAPNGCTPYGIEVNPLRNHVLIDNPGSGMIRYLVTGPDLPIITSVDVFSSSGQLVRHLEAGAPGLGSPGSLDIQGINIQNEPAGIYFVVLRQEDNIKTLRYVKR